MYKTFMELIILWLEFFSCLIWPGIDFSALKWILSYLLQDVDYMYFLGTFLTKYFYLLS